MFEDTNVCGCTNLGTSMEYEYVLGIHKSSHGLYYCMHVSAIGINGGEESRAYKWVVVEPNQPRLTIFLEHAVLRIEQLVRDELEELLPQAALVDRHFIHEHHLQPIYTRDIITRTRTVYKQINYESKTKRSNCLSK